MIELKDADEYPKFCPSCGQRRQLVSTIDSNEPETIYIGSPLPATKPRLQTAWESVDCTRCGLRWDSLQSPGQSVEDLTALTDSQLFQLAKTLSPVLKDLPTAIADEMGISPSYIVRVMNGKKPTNSKIEKAAGTVIRKRIHSDAV